MRGACSAALNEIIWLCAGWLASRTTPTSWHLLIKKFHRRPFEGEDIKMELYIHWMNFLMKLNINWREVRRVFLGRLPTDWIELASGAAQEADQRVSAGLDLKSFPTCDFCHQVNYNCAYNVRSVARPCTNFWLDVNSSIVFSRSGRKIAPCDRKLYTTLYIISPHSFSFNFTYIVHDDDFQRRIIWMTTKYVCSWWLRFELIAVRQADRRLFFINAVLCIWLSSRRNKINAAAVK